MGVQAEGLDFEEKSQFKGADREWLELVKSMVAMANTRGGSILLKGPTCSPQMLDSARLEDRIARVVRPRITAIKSDEQPPNAWLIEVEESSQKPHIFIAESSYTDGRGRKRSAFHPGQIWVRHSSKTEPATEEDIRRLIQLAASDLFRGLGKAIEKFAVRMGTEEAIPVKLGTEGIMSVSLRDPNEDFPYTAKSLGRELGKNQNWVAQAASALRLRGNRSYTIDILGASGRLVVRKYNQAAREFLSAKLEEDPDFNPWSA